MGVSSVVLVCTLVLATFLGHGDCRKAKSKVVFVTLSFESSPYFNCLELAEELVRRGLEVCTIFSFFSQSQLCCPCKTVYVRIIVAEVR